MKVRVRDERYIVIAGVGSAYITESLADYFTFVYVVRPRSRVHLLEEICICGVFSLRAVQYPKNVQEPNVCILLIHRFLHRGKNYCRIHSPLPQIPRHYGELIRPLSIRTRTIDPLGGRAKLWRDPSQDEQEQVPQRVTGRGTY